VAAHPHRVARVALVGSVCVVSLALHGFMLLLLAGVTVIEREPNRPRINTRAPMPDDDLASSKTFESPRWASDSSEQAADMVEGTKIEVTGNLICTSQGALTDHALLFLPGALSKYPWIIEAPASLKIHRYDDREVRVTGVALDAQHMRAASIFPEPPPAPGTLRLDGHPEIETLPRLSDKKMFPDGLQHDFGKVPQDLQCKHTFRIVNTTNVPLRILSFYGH
jgi:hypothetical protein